MNIITKLLITVLVFLVVITVAYLVESNFGLKRGSWQYETLIITALVTIGLVWHRTAPKDRPPHSGCRSCNFGSSRR
jgi:hypothetical protein